MIFADRARDAVRLAENASNEDRTEQALIGIAYGLIAIDSTLNAILEHLQDQVPARRR